eukprot:599311-Hanusia_phi.AAC.1
MGVSQRVSSEAASVQDTTASSTELPPSLSDDLPAFPEDVCSVDGQEANDPLLFLARFLKENHGETLNFEQNFSEDGDGTEGEGHVEEDGMEGERHVEEDGHYVTFGF